MDLELFKHELCTDFRDQFVMPNEEAQRFHEAYSHYHKIMTEINEKPLQNALWLSENFMTLHNNNNSKEMLEKVIEYCIKSKKKIINKCKR